MELKRYALLVDRPEGRCAKLGPLFKELGLRAMAVTSVAHAIDMVMKQQGLALVALSTDMGPLTTKALALTTRKQYPHVPIIWVSNTTPPSEVSQGPYFTHGPTTELDQLRSQVQRLLRQGHYPPEMVEQLHQATVNVLRESFRVSVLKHEAFLRFGRDLLSDIGAIIQFSGPGVQGRIIVGGTPEWFQTLLGPDARRQPDAEADVAGELCNRVLGRFKEFFETRSVPIQQSAPTVALGRGLELRDQDAVSVALRCSLDPADTHVLYVDLSLRGIFGDVTKKLVSATPILESGEVHFL